MILLYHLNLNQLTTTLQLEPYFSRVHFTKEQKKTWFRDREGVLFGFGVGFYFFLKTPILGVLIYGIAEASTAFLITKVTEPPPPPEQWNEQVENQVRWDNKHEFLKLPLDKLDALNVKARNAMDPRHETTAATTKGKQFT